MNVTPRTEEEVNANRRRLFEKGIYDFEIVKATDKVSKIKTMPDGSQKGGNPMIELMVKLFDKNGESTIIFDYLMDTEQMAYKLKHCCDAIGITAKYESGELVAGDFETGTGQLDLRVQKSKDPEYPDDKNTVQDYLPIRTEEEKKKMKQNHGIDLDDSIPF